MDPQQQFQAALADLFSTLVTVAIWAVAVGIAASIVMVFLSHRRP